MHEESLPENAGWLAVLLGWFALPYPAFMVTRAL